ncbi:hypothetical protein GCM10009810_06220 [Nostocoides vanveenii]|uniref:DUF1996 domain-containing protein n=1 Tax=Nostocoides vanveenii TaxID=330835 RepID=A0ABN2K4Y2_9MICO
MATIDPIVARGVRVSAHEHQFFGFAGWSQLADPTRADYADVVARDSTCDIAGDSAAYWAPTLRSTVTGALVKTARTEGYYWGWNVQKVDGAQATRAFPPDLRMVAGNPAAMSPADLDPSIVAWSCGTCRASPRGKASVTAPRSKRTVRRRYR